MRKEAVSHHMMNVYTYKDIDTIQDVAAILSSYRASRDISVALVTITLHFEHEKTSFSGVTAQAMQSTRYYLDNLRPLVRKTDTVLLQGHTFYFLLPGANLQGGFIVQERLWDALLWRIHNSEMLRPCQMHIGHSAYPLPTNTVEQCIAAASKAQRNFAPEKAMRKSTARQNAQHVRRFYQLSKESELPALARKLGIPYLSLLPRKLPAKVQRLVSPQLAQELHCYPLGRERDILTVAMSNPQDMNALDRLHQETGLHIFPVLAHPGELQTVLEQLV